jgi:anti-sigma B factor antagonist
MDNPVTGVREEDGTATVSVHGEIDFSNSDDVADGIRAALADWSPAELRIDLAAATFIDSTGLGALIEGYRAASDAQTRFVVVNPTITFRRVLVVTGLDDLFGLAAESEAGSEAAQPDLAI